MLKELRLFGRGIGSKNVPTFSGVACEAYQRGADQKADRHFSNSRRAINLGADDKDALPPLFTALR